MTGRLINGDDELGAADRWTYLTSALADLFRFDRSHPPGVTITRRGSPGETEERDVASTVSPWRMVAEDYLRGVITDLPDGSLAVVDMGCGSGAYADLFDERADRTQYIGIDVNAHERWSDERRTDSRVSRRFVEGDATVLRELDPVDAAMSCSALEHFRADREACEALFGVGKPGAVGFHVVPAKWSVFLFVYHGYRRYSRSTASQLLRDAGYERIEVRPLGGFGTFMLHTVWITWLREGMLPLLIFDLLTAGGRPGWMREKVRRFCCPGLVTGRRGSGLYVGLVPLARKVDRILPFPAIGYGVRGWKSNDEDGQLAV